MAKKHRKKADACYTPSAAKKGPKGTRMNSSTRRTSSDFLFARPSFLSGVARLMDFGCAFDAYNISQTPAKADVRAAVSDWLSVGDDVACAINSGIPEDPAA